MQIKKSTTANGSSRRMLKKLVSENKQQKKMLTDAARFARETEEKLIQTTMDLSLERRKAKKDLEQVKTTEIKLSADVRKVQEENVELKNRLAAEVVCNQKMVSRPECEICGQEYGEEEKRLPIIITCGHTLCYECILRLAAQQGGKFFSCPFDRKEFQLCCHGLACLIKNYAIIQLLGRNRSAGVCRAIE